MSGSTVTGRQKSARIATKESRRLSVDRANARRQQPTDLYPGLNDISDFLEAFPMEVIRYFSQLRELEAKCSNYANLLAVLIPRFLATGQEDPARLQQLAELHQIMGELVPYFDEKAVVATNASEAVARQMGRLDEDFDRITTGGELPDSVIFGPATHPALISDGGKDNDGAKSQTQASARSESRREAIAAKRAAQQIEDDNNSNNNNNNNIHIINNNSINNVNTSNINNGTLQSSISSKKRNTKTSNGSTKYAPVAKRRKQTTDKKDAVSGQNGGNSGSHLSISSGANFAASAAADTNARGQSPVRQGTPSHQQSTSSSSSRRGSGRAVQSRNSRRPPAAAPQASDPVSPSRDDGESEPVYCYCQQVSYGEMVGCDGPDCKREWFHLPCVGLTAPPKGQWFCNECAAKYKKSRARN
ncbi:hypothetical protein V1514DRAFT_303721 [Lipomyces japonicus]|uniref:uncharacterized protein n=1 Tax=Lipomyces japonicus TaxID=56871 RepID=UPI0034CF93D8